MERKNSQYDKMMNPQSMYCYPGTDILINTFDCKDPEILKTIETRLTILNLGRMHLKGITGKFDYKHYMSIHYDLFHQLYPHIAGRIRDENISKGNTPFCRPEFIGDYLGQVLDEMKKKASNIYDEQSLIHFLAYYYGEINIIHPFREGNGRAEREFFRQYVVYLNRYLSFGKYVLDYSNISDVDKKLLMEGSIESACMARYDKLEMFFSRMLKPLEKDRKKTL